MPIPAAFLLGLQASGMVIDYLGKRNQVDLAQSGNDLEQAGIENNIQNARLQSEDSSLQAMKQLRMNLGTQAAMYAARGVRSGTQNVVTSAANSTSNFNSDERMRRINKLSSEAALKTNAIISNLHQQAYKSKVYGGFTRDVFNKLPTSSEAWGKIGEGLSKKNSFGFGSSK